MADTQKLSIKPGTGHFYWILFKSTFIISAFTVGGGMVIIPLLKAKFVDEYGWIDDKETLDIVAIAQSMPGVMAVNAAIMLGYRMSGIAGKPLVKPPCGGMTTSGINLTFARLSPSSG